MQRVYQTNNPYHVNPTQTGYIYSNHGPELYYRRSMDCGVIVTVSRNLSLAFTIEWMDLRDTECTSSGDYLRVYKGSFVSAQAATGFICAFR